MEINLNEDTWPVIPVNRKSKFYLTPFLKSVRKWGGNGLLEGVLVAYIELPASSLVSLQR